MDLRSLLLLTNVVAFSAACHANFETPRRAMHPKIATNGMKSDPATGEQGGSVDPELQKYHARVAFLLAKKADTNYFKSISLQTMYKDMGITSNEELEKLKTDLEKDGRKGLVDDIFLVQFRQFKVDFTVSNMDKKIITLDDLKKATGATEDQIKSFEKYSVKTDTEFFKKINSVTKSKFK